MNQVKVSGFTIVRNAEILDYPFPECVLSVLPLVDEFVINCGDSDDNTLALCEELVCRYPEKIRLVRSSWERDNQSGGFQLKKQTDLALSHCTGDWCLYIQSDESLHEDDHRKIQIAIETASKRPEIDGILFDYLHFYGNFSYTIRGRNWYRREVRLIKRGRKIESFRDAQGFRINGERLKVISSGARVFHYGYVRSPESLKKKAIQMAQWWGTTPKISDEDLKPRRHVGLTLFEGSHPSVLRERITRNPLYFDPTTCRRKWDKNEIKNAVTLLWESLFPFRIGEFRNYELG